MNLSMACVTLKVNENNTGDVINYTVTFTTSFGNIAYKMQGYSSFLNGTWNVSQSANNFFWIAPSGYLTDHVHQKFKNITGNDFIGAGITFENDVYYFRISYNISGTYFFS